MSNQLRAVSFFEQGILFVTPIKPEAQSSLLKAKKYKCPALRRDETSDTTNPEASGELRTKARK